MQPQDLTALETDLDAEYVELERLLAALERERAALAAGVGEPVERIAADKEACASAVAGLGARRDAWLAACGLRGGMREALERLPANARPRHAWRRLLDKARQAKVMNDANGRLIAAHAQHLNGRLAALLGSAPAATYGPKGMPRLPGAGRSLGAG
jgi:flagellar biosynthesis/type III secretory pathway chaperone